jgi:hypothetical protein
MADPNFPAETGQHSVRNRHRGPLNAAVTANANASQTAAQFIREVGFTTDEDGNSAPVMIDFSYEKRTVAEDGAESSRQFKLSVPLLLLLHVPYFEVNTMTIDFNVKLNSVQTYQVNDQFAVDASLQAKHGWLTGHVKFSVNTSYQRQSQRGEKVERSYDQRVHVAAGSVEPPEGVKKLLGVLEETITERPQAA